MWGAAPQFPGDAALFARSDEIETAWHLIDPLIAGVVSGQHPGTLMYETGTWGPPEADELLAHDGLYARLYRMQKAEEASV